MILSYRSFSCWISIHAPHAGRDVPGPPASEPSGPDFNPRAPCGARPCALVMISRSKVFQSTRPMRGATNSPLCRAYAACISIHAPHAGRDHIRSSSRRSKSNFNPRAPCGARLTASTAGSSRTPFQSTRPMRGATSAARKRRPQRRYFNPRAPCGARPAQTALQ